ncbi:MAG: GNAT family N-acetyltransferase [Bacteroidetes bacterium]|nr:GNAT family N-acetyltransferase [Bacteroidota bacterium]MBL6962514.1 GNAT family N-acetyltransferase [Bacteroidota bacterium]
MENIIQAVKKELLKKELNEQRFLRNTNNGNNEIYIVSNNDSPNVITEIGRLREISFRDAGGGTGKSMDIDEFDLSEIPYKQLIVWDPEDEEIVGGYRFIHCSDVPKNENGQPQLATSELFHFSDQFIKDYIPYTVELGRSFVQPMYQLTYNFRKGMYSLDNLWDGLGAIVIEDPEIKYYFGKITMYPRFNIFARDMILFFLSKYFQDKNNLVTPIHAITLQTDLKKLQHTFYGETFQDDYRILVQEVRRLKENVPPLVNAYMNLSATMHYFGTAINKSFGDVEESGIIIAIDDIYDIKKDRHLSTYVKEDRRASKNS